MRSQLPMQSMQSMQSGQSTQATKESRWKGTGRMNRSELLLLCRCAGFFLLRVFLNCFFFVK